MKKFITAVCSAMLVVVLAFALTGCSKADKIKKAYEDAGYEVTTVSIKDSSKAKAALVLFGFTDDQVKEAESWEVISATKAALASPAFVLKFPSSSKLKEFLTVEKEDGTKDTKLYDSQNEAGHVKGDCWLFAGVGNAEEVFKNA